MMLLQIIIVTVGFIITTCEGEFSDTDSRIVNGRDAEIGEIPYQVQLSRNRNQPFCGGSIIDLYHVITAVHCVQLARGREQAFYVIAGVHHKYDYDNPNRMELPFEKVYEHEDYAERDTGVFNDIAIVRVKGGFKTFNNFIRPIALAKENTNDGVCMITGWGSTRPSRSMTKLKRQAGIALQVLDIPIIDFEECQKMAAANQIKIKPGIVCAGYSEGNKDACQGDSGGPLACGMKLVGIVSFGIGCARPNVPGIYSDVAFYKDWIDKTLKQSYQDGNLPD